MSRYLFILLACFLITLPLEFAFRAKVYRNFLIALRAIWLPALFYIIWDIFATRYNHWDFSKQHVGDIVLLRLPVEEYFFFLVIPLCALLTYGSVTHLSGFVHSKFSPIRAWLGFLAIYLTLGLTIQLFRINEYSPQFPNRSFPSYTLATFIFCIGLITWIFKSPDRVRFIKTRQYFITIAICLFFMVFVNGYLTILDDPVVTYTANLGPRIFFDIPIEDFFYGTALLTWVLLRWNAINNEKPIAEKD